MDSTCNERHNLDGLSAEDKKPVAALNGTECKYSSQFVLYIFYYRINEVNGRSFKTFKQLFTQSTTRAVTAGPAATLDFSFKVKYIDLDLETQTNYKPRTPSIIPEMIAEVLEQLFSS